MNDPGRVAGDLDVQDAGLAFMPCLNLNARSFHSSIDLGNILEEYSAKYVGTSKITLQQKSTSDFII